MKPYKCPFRIVIDSAEQHAFGFENIRGDYAIAYRPVDVPTTFRSLGRHPNSYGDYTIENRTTGESFARNVAIERKSVDDYQQTLLGWSKAKDEPDKSRRERFYSELANLASIDSAVVVVEGVFSEVIESAPDWGVNEPITNARILYTTTVGIIQDFGVPIMFVGNRRAAEIFVFRFFWRFWKKRKPCSVCGGMGRNHAKWCATLRRL